MRRVEMCTVHHRGDGNADFERLVERLSVFVRVEQWIATLELCMETFHLGMGARIHILGGINNNFKFLFPCKGLCVVTGGRCPTVRTQ